jgi:hypothetical protein
VTERVVKRLSPAESADSPRWLSPLAEAGSVLCSDRVHRCTDESLKRAEGALSGGVSRGPARAKEEYLSNMLFTLNHQV